MSIPFKILISILAVCPILTLIVGGVLFNIADVPKDTSILVGGILAIIISIIMFKAPTEEQMLNSLNEAKQIKKFQNLTVIVWSLICLIPFLFVLAGVANYGSSLEDFFAYAGVCVLFLTIGLIVYGLIAESNSIVKDKTFTKGILVFAAGAATGATLNHISKK